VSPQATEGAPPSTEIAVKGPAAPAASIPESWSSAEAVTRTGPALQPDRMPSIETEGRLSSTLKTAVETPEATPAPDTEATRK